MGGEPWRKHEAAAARFQLDGVRIRWSSRAIADLARLGIFIEPHNPVAASRIVVDLVRAGEQLADTPLLGFRLGRYAPREVRRLIAGSYELRYELRDGDVLILRIWHTREDRG